MSKIRNSTHLLLLALAIGTASAAEPGTIMERVLQEHEAQTVEIDDMSGLLVALTREVQSQAPELTDPSAVFPGFARTAVPPPPATGAFVGTASAAAWEGAGSYPTVVHAPGSVLIEGSRSNWAGVVPAAHAMPAPVTAMTLEQGQQYIVTNSASNAGNTQGAINIGSTGLNNVFGDISNTTMGAVNSGSVQITIGGSPAIPAP
jgi:hypothetical protein